MQHLLLVDETFDLNFTPEYYLSIQFSLDGFSFCIRDGLQNKYIYLFHKEFSGNPKFLHRKLKDIYSEFEILNGDFKRTKLIFSSPGRMMLLPKSFFEERHGQAICQLNMDLADDEEFCYLPVKPFDQVLQMAMPRKVKQFVNGKHPGVVIQNELALQLSASARQTSLHPVMNVLLYRNQLTLTLLDQTTIRFCNSFKYRNDNDLLYYILNVVQSEQVNELTIQLSGRVNKRSPIYHLLRQYFKDVTIVSPSSEVYYSYLFDQLPDARFVNLLNDQE
ncbi:DUF3822 family protein [uncultured Sunxiuqinia sp.]|uniref:DUF3822 family protein n=1 Tax=uncultured Sunxiuqinia sp. TaxID=1573825 RepID=UPI0030DDAF31|tara:strand:+ start:48704 stop:49534 length:831 start_codon:yes stop_codon:yes gene_type:complete